MNSNTITLSWNYNKIEQVVEFVNLDDAKSCYQALRDNGYSAHLSIPHGYKELPFKRYEGDGILSDKEMANLKAKLDAMTLVH